MKAAIGSGGKGMRRPCTRVQSRAQAIFDSVVAATCLIVFSPIMALAALAVVLESGWPVIFVQQRVGRNGQAFHLYKFRKFHRLAGDSGGALTLRNDPRLTRVGWLLERTKLDELPQLWNVLKGDMAIVGPRPESLHFADCFAQYPRVLAYKPGIFGPAQAITRNEGVLHKANADSDDYYREVLFPTKARIDLAYYPMRTIVRDIGWIIVGVLAILGCGRVPQIGAHSVQALETWVRAGPAFGRAPIPSNELAPGE